MHSDRARRFPVPWPFADVSWLTLQGEFAGEIDAAYSLLLPEKNAKGVRGVGLGAEMNWD